VEWIEEREAHGEKGRTIGSHNRWQAGKYR
jgi:hypothetical protein